MSRIDDIEARMTAAGARAEEALRDLPDSRLLSRAEHDRQRLVKDQVLLVAFVREVEAAYRRNVETGAAAMHLRGDLRGALDRLNGGA